MRRRRMGCPTSRVGNEGAAVGLAERDSGGAQADTGRGVAAAGVNQPKVSALKGTSWRVLGGAADALRYGAATRCGDRDSPARGGRGAARVMVVGRRRARWLIRSLTPPMRSATPASKDRSSGTRSLRMNGALRLEEPQRPANVSIAVTED